MHTETLTSRVEQYITAYRTRVTAWVGVALTVVLYVAWFTLSRTVLHVQSPTLDACVFGLSAMGSAIAALAFYWGAE